MCIFISVVDPIYIFKKKPNNSALLIVLSIVGTQTWLEYYFKESVVLKKYLYMEKGRAVTGIACSSKYLRGLSALAMPLKQLPCTAFFQAFPTSLFSPVAKNGMCICGAEVKTPPAQTVASLIPNKKTGFRLVRLLFWAMQCSGEPYFSLLTEMGHSCCCRNWVHLPPCPSSSADAACWRREHVGVKGKKRLLARTSCRIL